jgi:protein FrlC
MMLNASHICATNFTYSHYRLNHCLDDVAALGVQWFELWGVAPHLHIDTVQEADLQALRRELAERELKLACFTPEQCVYPVNIAAETRCSGSTALTISAAAWRYAKALSRLYCL